MSEPTAPPPGEPTGSTDRKALKQDVAAAKARSKAARPWYKKKRFIIPLALVVLIVLGNLGGDDENTGGEVATEPTEGTTTDEAAEAATDEATEDVPDEATEDIPDEVSDDAEFATVGEEARDGDFAFTINSIENLGPVLESDNQFIEDLEASGVYYQLEISIENIGDEAQTMSASNQYLYDVDERRFSAVSSFDLIGIDMETPVFEQLNPGTSVDGQIVFDVPEDVEIEFAELHDSALSGGVLVDLRE